MVYKTEQLYKVLKEFFNVEKVKSVNIEKTGYINTTYIVEMPECKYLLQKINTHVFYSPYAVMHNIESVIEYMKKNIIFNGKDPNRSLLTFIKTKHDQNIAIVDDEYWRCMRYIDDSVTYNNVTDPDLFQDMGRVIAEFQVSLSGIHTRILDDTIKHFHDTGYRYNRFKNTIKLDLFDRVKNCQEEIDFISAHSRLYNIINKKLEEGFLPRRVVHNDTKPSNVLIDKANNKALCLIDFDTVMKGSLVYDYGDAIRVGASTASEDEQDLDKVKIDLKMIKAFTIGYLKEIKPIIKPLEVKNLYNGYLIMTLEVAMRFLDDYLDGDRYFQTSYENHNLIRAKNQICLVKEIEENKQEIKKIIHDALIELEYSDEFLCCN